MSTPHFALLPAAGMGHLIPFLRLAATLSSHGSQITLITAHPTVSISESNHLTAFLSSYPTIKHYHFNLIQSDQHSHTQRIIEDPFFQQFDTIRRSLTNLLPIFHNSPLPFTALITDILLADTTFAVLSHLNLPSYILCTSSARFLALISYLTPLLPKLILSGSADLADIEIPGVTTISKSSVPSPFLNPNHYFHTLVSANAKSFPKFDGILINTFSEFEPKTLNALNKNSSLQSILPIGPLPPIHLSIDDNLNNNNSSKFIIEWLDTQQPSSVVLLSFGSRTAMSKTQITELAKALINNYRFVWILKGSKVDRDDKDDLTDLLGKQFLDQIGRQKSGVVVNVWVNQQAILSHVAIGGFVSHCGWNSVTEAAVRGVPVLAWPLHGDQKLNAEVVVEAGFGIWDEGWGWGGERLVTAEEIERKLVELMEGDCGLKSRAARVGEEARRAVDGDGSSDLMVRLLVEKVKSRSCNLS